MSYGHCNPLLELRKAEPVVSRRELHLIFILAVFMLHQRPSNRRPIALGVAYDAVGLSTIQLT